MPINKSSNSSQWEEKLQQLVAHCTKQGWSVKFMPGTECNAYADGRITIGSGSTLRNQFYMLLHEAGHMILFGRKDYMKKYGKYDHAGYSQLRKLKLLEEEIAAWDAGEALAQKKGWKLDKQFAVLRASKLSSYCLWATHRKHPWEGFKRST